jgi:hypothetical protein
MATRVTTVIQVAKELRVGTVFVTGLVKSRPYEYRFICKYECKLINSLEFYVLVAFCLPKLR